METVETTAIIVALFTATLGLGWYLERKIDKTTADIKADLRAMRADIKAMENSLTFDLRAMRADIKAMENSLTVEIRAMTTDLTASLEAMENSLAIDFRAMTTDPDRRAGSVQPQDRARL